MAKSRKAPAEAPPPPLPASVLPSRVEQLKSAADEAFRQGDTLRALAFLEQAYATDPQPGILASRGLMLERLGDFKRAAADFDAYLKTAPPPEKRTPIETSLRRIRPDLLIGSTPAGLVIHLDDAPEPLGTTPVKLPVLAGAHLIRFSHADYLPGDLAVVVEPGQEAAVQLIALSKPTAVGPAQSDNSQNQKLGLTGLGIGAASGLLGGTMFILMSSARDDRDTSTTRADWTRDDGRAEVYQAAGAAALGVAITALTGGLFLLWSEP